MFLLALLPGIGFPALVGWLALDLIEGKVPVLLRAEKWVLGGVLGLTVTMFFAFFGNILVGIPLTLPGFLSVVTSLLVVLGIPWWLKKAPAVAPGLPPLEKPSFRITALLAVIGGWVALRVISASVITLLVPSYFDDTTDNWNLRGKMFYFAKNFTLELPWGGTTGISSYPPTVSLSKAWLSTFAGSWHEGLVNSIHVAWFFALLLLMYWSLRRLLPIAWATLGTIILASLPLELIHGTNAYADVFLSVHLFAAIVLMMHAVRESSPDRAATWLRLAGFALALVPFTKNEGWALYFPVLFVLYVLTLLWLWRRNTLTTRNIVANGAMAGAMILAVIVPWISFKVLNGLAFGNAKGIDLNFAWQKGVALSVTVNTFFEGNWSLLFPLFFTLLFARWRTALRTPLVLLTAFFAVPYVGQLVAYLTTGLSTEALLQTGYARGLIHLMPVIVTITTVLLHDAVHLLYSPHAIVRSVHRTPASPEPGGTGGDGAGLSAA